MRYGQPECEHGMPGGSPSVCALCRTMAAHLEQLDRWPDVAMLAAGDR